MDKHDIIYNLGQPIIELHYNVISNHPDTFKHFDYCHGLIIVENVDRTLCNLLNLKQLLIDSCMVISRRRHGRFGIYYYNIKLTEASRLIKEYELFMAGLYKRKGTIFFNCTVDILDKKFGCKDITNLICRYLVSRTMLRQKRFEAMSPWLKIQDRPLMFTVRDDTYGSLKHCYLPQGVTPVKMLY